MLKSLRIAIVDDHPLMRAGIEATLKRDTAIEVVATGANAQDAINIAKEFAPDIMLIDVNMPGNGMTAARSISKDCPEIRVLFLTVSERQEDVTNALEVGARGYILKGISGPDLLRTIHSVALGETYITPEFAARLLASPMGRPLTSAKSIDPELHLSVREEQILREVALGQTNKEIAKKLELSEKTIKHYMSGILQKLSARNRVEAVVALKRLRDEGKL